MTAAATALGSGLLQFGAVEVAALEKLQWHFVNPSLAPIKFEFFPAVRSRTAYAHFWFIYAQLRLWSNDNPRPTFRTCDARAHNAMVDVQIDTLRKPSSLTSSELDQYRSRFERILALYEQLDLVARKRFYSRPQTAA